MATINQAFTFHDTDAESGEVIVSPLIEVGQDGGLAANQGTIAGNAAIGDPPNDCLKQRRLVVRHRHVVQEEERFCSCAEQVVDAHRHQIDANGVVDAGCHRQLEFGADAVGAGDKQRIVVLAGEEALQLELKDGGKTALLAHHPWALRPPHVRGQSRHRLLVEGKIDTST